MGTKNLKTPICTFDAKTGVLCQGCEAKLEAGQLTTSEIETAIKLTQLGQKERALDNLSLMSAARSGSELILFLKGTDILYLRSNPELLKKLEKELGQVVWLIEAQATGKKFIENLFFPSKVINMNFFWLPDGKKLTRVLIEKNDPRIVAKATKIHDIAKDLRNVDLIVEYQS